LGSAKKSLLSGREQVLISIQVCVIASRDWYGAQKSIKNEKNLKIGIEVNFSIS
jgi:hypothetical protein